MAVTTLAEYKAYLRITGSGDDAWLTILVASACDLIERYCGRPPLGFEQGAKTEFLSGRGNEYLFPRCWPVNSVTSIESLASDGALTAVDAASYRVKNGNVIARTGVMRGSLGDGWDGGEREYVRFDASPRFAEGDGNYKVIYDGGYAVVPSTVKHAAWIAADWMRASAGRDPTASSESIGSYSISYGQGQAFRTQNGVALPAQAAVLLGSHAEVLP